MRAGFFYYVVKFRKENKMVRIQELKSDTKYKDIFSITPKEYKAMELLALSDGEIFQPLFVWKGQGILVYGYHYWEILKTHPKIKYAISCQDTRSLNSRIKSSERLGCRDI